MRRDIAILIILESFWLIDGQDALSRHFQSKKSSEKIEWGLVYLEKIKNWWNFRQINPI